MGSGTVYLVGAGPGAPDLLTLRAVKLLERAEIVFHDALIDKEVLNHCAPECVFVPVGVRGGCPNLHRQSKIHALLEDAVQRYTTVVRLKGGDPCVFGRGGEEVEFLTSRGIPWEIVPGISAGIGGLSLLGLPVTHRDLASAVTLMTGSHVSSGAFEGLPAFAPAAASQTFVFYMALQNITRIVQQLLQQGVSPDTYALCASWLSYPQQKVVAAPLSQIAAEASKAQMEAPVLMVVGEVVHFWHKLRQGAASPGEL